MKTISLSGYDELLDECRRLNVASENNVRFRGTSNPLIPSLVERCWSNQYRNFARIETEILAEFDRHVSTGYSYNHPSARDWEVRINAREYGLMSSLMDWTHSIEIATEFAIRNFEFKNIESTSIWALVCQGMDTIIVNEALSACFDEIEEPAIVEYTLSAAYSSRMHSHRKFIQGGSFLKQSYFEIETPLLQKDYFRDRLIQFLITKDVVAKVREGLSRKIDITQDAMLGNTELDDLCLELNEKYSSWRP